MIPLNSCEGTAQTDKDMYTAEGGKFRFLVDEAAGCTTALYETCQERFASQCFVKYGDCESAFPVDDPFNTGDLPRSTVAIQG
jgi:hypothetical protein